MKWVFFISFLVIVDVTKETNVMNQKYFVCAILMSCDKVTYKIDKKRETNHQVRRWQAHCPNERIADEQKKEYLSIIY